MFFKIGGALKNFANFTEKTPVSLFNKVAVLQVTNFYKNRES